VLFLVACRWFPMSHRLVEVNGVTLSTSARTPSLRGQPLQLHMDNSNNLPTINHLLRHKEASHCTLLARHVLVLATLAPALISLHHTALLHHKLDLLDQQLSQCKAWSLVSQ
jgi:hypothetical protein